MIKVALRVYNRDIETLIDQGHTEEAVSHCMHILKSFPKHLETYRLLGKAYLEAHQYTEAADIFTRVLLAVPDDFVSHLGMSIIYDEKHDLAGAIWHMERAFEINSTNGGIQNELRRLYGRRDGVEPARIHLTRGALSQIYTKAGEFQQAIAEIKSLLAEDPTRTDMKSLLAKAYFQSGMKNEAVESCTELLKTYIFNLEANRILAAILMGTNLAKELEQVQQRVHALDPYTAQAAPPFFNTMSVPDGAVMLEKLEWIPGKQTNEKWNLPGEVNKGVPAAAAVGNIENSTNRETAPSMEETSAGDSPELPDWLKSFDSSTGAVITGDNGESADLSWLETPAENDEEIPIIEDTSVLPTEIQDNSEIPVDQEIAAPETESTGDESIELESTALLIEEKPVEIAEIQQAVDGLPEWLKQTDNVEMESPFDTTEHAAVITEEVEQPVDTSTVVQIEAEPVEIPASETGGTSEQPAANTEDDWFSASQDESGGLTLPPLPVETASDDDWFTNLDNKIENPISLDSDTTSPLTEEIPDWLQELEAKSSTIESVSIPTESLTDQNGDQILAAMADQSDLNSPAEVNPNLPEWLQDLDFGTFGQTPAADDGKITSVSAEPDTSASPESVFESNEVPEWLQGLEFPSNHDGEISPVPAGPVTDAAPGSDSESNDIPDWLQGLEFKSNTDGDTDSEVSGNNINEIPVQKTEELSDGAGELQDEIVPDISLVLGDNIPSPDAADSSTMPALKLKDENTPAELHSESNSWLDELTGSSPAAETSVPDDSQQNISGADQALAWLDSLGQNETAPAESLIDLNQPVTNHDDVKFDLNFADNSDPFAETMPETAQANGLIADNEYPAWMQINDQTEPSVSIIPAETAIDPAVTLPPAVESIEEIPTISIVGDAVVPAEITPELGQESQAETLSWLESLVQQVDSNPVDMINASTIQPSELPVAASLPVESSNSDTGEEIDPREIPAELMETKPTRISKITQSSLVEPVKPESTESEIPDWAKDIIPSMEKPLEQTGIAPVDDENFDWLGDLSRPQNTSVIEENIPQQTSNDLSVEGKELPEPPQISLDWVQGYSPHMNPADTGLADKSPIQQNEISSAAGILQPETGEISAPDFISSADNDNILDNILAVVLPVQQIDSGEMTLLEPVIDTLTDSETGVTSAEVPAETINQPAAAELDENSVQPETLSSEPTVSIPLDENAERTKAWLESLGPEAEPVSFTPLPWVPADIDAEEGVPEETADDTEENSPIPVDESSDWYETLKSSSSGKEAEPLEWSNPKNDSDPFSEDEPLELPTQRSAAGEDPFAVEDNEIPNATPLDEIGDYFTISNALAEDSRQIQSSDFADSLPREIPDEQPLISVKSESNEQVDIFETGNPDSPISFIEDEIPEPAPLSEDNPAPVDSNEVEIPVPLATAAPIDKDRQTLEKAREMLVRGKLAEAANEYSRLIKKAKLLDEIIYDLQQAVYRQPVDILTWQTLGDAYFRANKLQEALDAYGKAEGLLR